MQEDKYLVQLLERTEHFCKSFKVVTLTKLPDWIEEMQLLIDHCTKKNPTHSYVMYISNNTVDLAKGEDLLIQQEATKRLKRQQSKVGITTSTKAMYLGMSRAITSFDFDSKTMPKKLQGQVVWVLENYPCLKREEYTLTTNGIHVHIPSKHKDAFLRITNEHNLDEYLDKVGHDLCSPLANTYKDGYLITRHIIRG